MYRKYTSEEKLNIEEGYLNGIFSLEENSIKELADIYVNVGKEIFDYDGKVVYQKSEDKEYLTHNPERRCPDITKAKEKLHYAPSINVYEVKSTLEQIQDDKFRVLVTKSTIPPSTTSHHKGYTCMIFQAIIIRGKLRW